MKKTLYLVSVSTLMFSGCVPTPAVPEHERPTHWGKSIQPAHNFYQVSPTLFRSEQPNDQLGSLIKQQDIDVVINLRSRHHDPKVLNPEKFKLIHVPIHTWALDREDLLKVMQHIQHAKQQDQKVLLHCYHGSDRTGASVAMYRIIFEHWSIEQAVQEMKHGGYGFHRIWRNIEALFTEENVKWIREQLPNPS